MSWRPPYARPRLVKQLKLLTEASVSGRRLQANRIFRSLPAETRGVLAMMQFYGRFADWAERIAELKELRRLVAENPPRSEEGLH